MRSLLVLSSLLFLGCSGSPPPSPSAPPPAAAEQATGSGGNAVRTASQDADASAAPPDGGRTGEGAVASKASDDPFAALPPSLPIPEAGKPAAVKRTGGKWPFHKWTRAETVISNWAPYGPETKMHAYDENGWSPVVKYRGALDEARAKQAVDLVHRARGEMLVSKCPAPRHSVVLFDGDLPVASIDVCLTCHDVLLWPKWPSEPTAADYHLMAKANAEFFPRWESFFVEELRFPLFPNTQRLGG